VSGNLGLHGGNEARDASREHPRGLVQPSTVTGIHPVTFADYGIANPSNPIAQTESSGTLEFSLKLRAEVVLKKQARCPSASASSESLHWHTTTHRTRPGQPGRRLDLKGGRHR